MAIWINVLCRCADPVTYSELEDVMGHMGWLDRPAEFDPPLDEKNGTDPNWGSFRVKYASDKRPIVVHHFIKQEEMEPTLSDIRDKLEDFDDSEQKQEIVRRAKETRQMFQFEIPGDLPQDVWEMCDQAEAFLARERDGIIVSDEGVFDGEMKQLLRLGN
jgi:hypothetical protein